MASRGEGRRFLAWRGRAVAPGHGRGACCARQALRTCSDDLREDGGRTGYNDQSQDAPADGRTDPPEAADEEIIDCLILYYPPYAVKSPINTQTLSARLIRVADDHCARNFNPGVAFTVTPDAPTNVTCPVFV